MSSVMDRYKANRKKSRRATVVALISLAVVTAALAAYFVGGPQAVGFTSPEQKAVRNWLTLNLDDPNFEEVQWWPARDRYTLGDFEKRLEERERLGLEPIENLRIVRLKFRTKNKFGATVLEDRVFAIDGDGVQMADMNNSLGGLQYNRERLFEGKLSEQQKGQQQLGKFVNDVMKNKKKPK